MKKAVVFLSDGFEEIEALTAVDYLRRAKVDVMTVAVPPEGKTAIDMPTGSHNICMKADCSFEEFFTAGRELPDLVYLPGGIPGAPNLAACVQLTDFIKRCFDAGKYVAAICAAPAVVLAKTGVLAGKKWTCYPGMEAHLADYCGGQDKADGCMKDSVFVGDKPFVTDGTVITGRGAGAAEQLAMELVRLLAGEETMQKLKVATVQR
ncbi:MAG: DJ-1 family glyoxalase III [Treponema sp.]